MRGRCASGDGIALVDLKSKRGTWVGETRLAPYAKPAAIEAGTLVRLGDGDARGAAGVERGRRYFAWAFLTSAGAGAAATSGAVPLSFSASEMLTPAWAAARFSSWMRS